MAHTSLVQIPWHCVLLLLVMWAVRMEFVLYIYIYTVTQATFGSEVVWIYWLPHSLWIMQLLHKTSLLCKHIIPYEYSFSD